MEDKVLQGLANRAVQKCIDALQLVTEQLERLLQDEAEPFETVTAEEEDPLPYSVDTLLGESPILAATYRPTTPYLGSYGDPKDSEDVISDYNASQERGRLEATTESDAESKYEDLSVI